MSPLAIMRLEAGFETQRELSEASGVGVDTISRIERGDTEAPHSRTLGKLAKAMGKSTAEVARRMAGETEVAA